VPFAVTGHYTFLNGCEGETLIAEKSRPDWININK
jgi:hypothetical protein